MMRRNGRPLERDMDEDCMPFTRAEWEALDPLIEQAYRRGFYQGPHSVLFASKNRATVTELEKWLFGPLLNWRCNDLMYQECPPGPPHLPWPQLGSLTKAAASRVLGIAPSESATTFSDGA